MQETIRTARDDLGDVQVVTSTHIISAVMRIYRERTPAGRERCLDVINALADIGAWVYRTRWPTNGDRHQPGKVTNGP